jgi:hypothetical protein
MAAFARCAATRERHAAPAVNESSLRILNGADLNGAETVDGILMIVMFQEFSVRF